MLNFTKIRFKITEILSSKVLAVYITLIIWEISEDLIANQCFPIFVLKKTEIIE
jgi:hypothetical protein